MKRHVPTKISALHARHPSLRDRLHGMFEEFWPMAEVQQMIASHYGESLSLRTLARYKQRHWQAQRDLVQFLDAALQEAGEQIIASSDHRVVSLLGHRAICSSGHRVIDALNHRAAASSGRRVIARHCEFGIMNYESVKRAASA